VSDSAAVSLSQQKGSNGIDTYTASLYGYSPGTYNQLISQNANGSTAQSAFKSLMSKLSGLGNKNESGTAANDLQDQFNELDANLTQNFGTGTGSVSTSKGFENTPQGLQNCNSSSVTVNISNTGQVTGADVRDAPPTPEQMQQQFQTSVSSLSRNPVNQMTNGQTMAYIDTVIQSLKSAGQV